jgi:heme exporter protein D
VNWASWQDFFAMGGYALYVWGSYAVTFILIALELLLLALRRRALLQHLGVREAENP